MPRKSIRLQIENPCKQDWNSMPVSGDGRFCTHCAKHVVDLTRMSDNEILRRFKEMPGGFCSRIRKEQLRRPIVYSGTYPERPGWYKILAGVFILAGASNVSAQTPTIKAPIEVSDSFISQSDSVKPVKVTDYGSRTIRGIVYNKNTGESLRSIFIGVKGLDAFDFTGETGEFSITIPDSVTRTSLTVIVYDDNYKTQRLRIHLSDMPLRKDFALVPRKHPKDQPDYYEMGFNTEAYIVGQYEGAVKKKKSDKKRWQFWRR